MPCYKTTLFAVVYNVINVYEEEASDLVKE